MLLTLYSKTCGWWQKGDGEKGFMTSVVEMPSDNRKMDNEL